LANQIDSDGEKEFDSKAWKAYKNLVPAEIEKVKTGENPLFRESATLNEHEFFAVALENFFERPWEFFQARQELYLAMVGLMRLDPRVWEKAKRVSDD
jgi:MtfA peptidase